MNKLIIYLSILTTVLSCSGNSEEKKEVIANAKTEFSIDGMTCDVGCAKKIESKLTNMDGVSSSSVDFENKTAVVSFNKDVVSFEDFKKMIEELNQNQYSVSKISEASESNPIQNSSVSSEEDYNNLWDTDFELPSILDFFINIV